MGQNPSKGASVGKYNALRMSGRAPGHEKDVSVRLKDGTEVNLENVCSLYAQRYLEDKEDATRLLNVIESNFDRLLRTKERRHSFLLLPKAAFINVLQSDDLYAASEYTILVLVGAWVDNQITIRMEKAKKKAKKSKKKKKKTKKEDKKKAQSEDKKKGQSEPKKDEKKEEEETDDPLVLEEKLKQKQLEQDAILAALLQDAGDDADITKLVEAVSLDDPDVLDAETINDFLENLKGIEIPHEKSTAEYEENLRQGIAEFAQYIRFPSMPDEHLSMVMNEGLVPEDFIHEALRYHALAEQEEDYYKKQKSINPRFKSRSQYFTVAWDPAKKDTRLKVNKDGTVVTVVPGTGCAHKAIIGKYPITHGRAVFELTLNQQAGCYDAIGVVDSKFKVQSDSIIGIFPNSWGLGLYAGTHVATSNRRIQLSSYGSMPAGTKIKVVLDMDVGTIEFIVNGTSQGKLKGLRGPLYPAMTMCEMSGNGHSIKNVSRM